MAGFGRCSFGFAVIIYLNPQAAAMSRRVALLFYEHRILGMRFEALGPLRVVDGDPVQLRPAHRRFVSLLLLSSGTPMSVDTLVDRMWGEAPPPSARDILYRYSSVLKRSIPGAISAGRDGYTIDLSSHEFDVRIFDGMATESALHLSEGRFTQALGSAVGATTMWRGDPYEELVDVSMARGERQRLEELLVSVRMTQVRALTSLGRMSESIALLRQTVSDRPFDESLWEELILAYYLAGRQADALWAYREASRTLAKELGVEPGPRLKELEEKILFQEPGLLDGSVLVIPNNLPRVESSFVGRDRDVLELKKLLAAHHLISVTGAPGVGKTRLATETGTSVIRDFPAGVWLARLVGATTESEVSATISAAMGVVESGFQHINDLYRDLAPRPALLILDSCEHVLDPVRAFLSSPLRTDRLRVLVTSRARLGAENEVVWPVQPLDVPTVADEIWDTASWRLLVDRLSAVDPALDIAVLDARDLMEICQRTEGIPLALELVARWMKSLDTPDAVAHILRPASGGTEDDSLHDSSLGDAIERSLALLGNADREAFIAASVFASAFTLDAFDTVCVGELTRRQTIDITTRLVEASLLKSEHVRDSVRYRLLEPLKEYGWESCTPGQARAVRDRHAGWIADSARAVAAAVFTEAEPAAYAGVDEGIADYRQAMRHLLDTGQVGEATEIAVSLVHYWISRFLAGEGRQWLRECLKESDHARTLRILAAEGEIAFYVGEYDLSAERFAQLRKAAVAVGDRRREAEALHGLGLVESYRQRERGAGYHLEAAAILDGLSERAMAAKCRTYVGMHLALAGETAKASEYLTQALAVSEAEGAHRIASFCHRFLGVISWLNDDENQARSHLQDAQTHALESNDQRIISGTGQLRALIEGRWGDLAIAASSLIDMTNAVLAQHGIYFAMMAYVATPLLVAGELWDLAARLFSHVDQVYEEYGWAPLDEQNVIARRFRAEVNARVLASGLVPDLSPVATATIADELVTALTRVLASDSQQRATSN